MTLACLSVYSSPVPNGPGNEEGQRHGSHIRRLLAHRAAALQLPAIRSGRVTPRGPQPAARFPEKAKPCHGWREAARRLRPALHPKRPLGWLTMTSKRTTHDRMTMEPAARCCLMCGCKLNVVGNPMSADAGGDCWGCIGMIEADGGLRAIHSSGSK